MSYTVICDSREKVGAWDFLIFPECRAQLVRGLKTADYTLEGYEDILAIERKRTSGEIANNLGIKVKQFTDECARLQAFTHKYIICEFSLEDILRFPVGSGIPQRVWGKLRINGKYLAKKLTQLSEENGIQLIFCESRENAVLAAHEIFKCIVQAQ